LDDIDASVGCPPGARFSPVGHAYFYAGPDVWTQAATIPVAVNALYPEVVIDEFGRVTVTWYENILDVTFHVKSARYSPTAPAQWTSARVIGASGHIANGGPNRLVIDEDGAITAIWTFVNNSPVPPQYSILVARYNSSTDTWGDDTPLETGQGTGRGAELVADAEGNIGAIWQQPLPATPPFENFQLRFARFDKDAGNWSSPATIPGTFNVDSERMAPLSDGDFMAVWAAPLGGGDIAQASRFQLSAGTWTPAVTLSAPLGDADVGDIETDARGNAFAVWNRFDGVQEVAQAARYNFATGQWSIARDLGVMGDDGEDVQVAVNGAGNAIFGWEFEDDPTDVEKVQWTEWLAVPAAPTITSISPGNQSLVVAFTPPSTPEPAFGATHYEYLLENVTHLGWIGRTPPFTGSPITVVSLTNGATYRVRVRAWNAAGAGAPSDAVNGTAGTGLQAPIDLRVVSITGNTVTLAWTVPTGTLPPTGFELEGGVTPGAVLATVPTGSSATTFTFAAPTGAFYVRMRALAGATRSGPSNEIRIFVNVPIPPEAPENLAGTAVSSTLNLTWRNSATGGWPTRLFSRSVGRLPRR
jgi:hypothetical protein